MRRESLATFFLFVVIILWGTLLGGIAYSHLVYFPAYLSHLPASAVVVTGQYGMDEAIFWILIHPLLILSLTAALALNWKSPARRKLIGVSFTVYAAVLVITWSYFVPELLAFSKSAESTLTPADWLVRTHRWQHLSWMRGLTIYAAFVPLLQALRTPSTATGAPGR